MADNLVNGIYPVQYFSLPGVDTINYPDNFWWSSKERYAAIDVDGVTYKPFADGGALTSEILEIDLGRIREINYINFDVLRAPISIKVEYDLISSPDRDAVWLPVTPIEAQDFDQDVSFDPNNRTSWLNAEFNFTDSKGNMAHTRYIRITFQRRDESWPTQNNSAFPWPVFVKQLRVGRNTTQLIDTVGPLLTQDTPLGLDEVDLFSPDNITSREARQQFVVNPSQFRSDVAPNMLGFGVLIQSASPATPFDQSEIPGEVSIGWSIWDVTTPDTPIFLLNGVETTALTTGLSWIDWYLNQSTQIEVSSTKIYELRVFSKDVSAADIVFTHTPNVLSNTPIPGTLTFTHGSSSVATSVDVRDTVKIGDLIVRSDIPDQVFLVNNTSSSTITLNVSYSGASASGVTGAIVYPLFLYDEDADAYVADGTRNLVCRVWADIGDEGRDVLGNSYRYVFRQQSAENALATSDDAGWMSEPQPSADAVEALYFDVRGADPDTGYPIPSVIEAITISPRTPGVRMNVYWTMQGINGEAPVQTVDWDYLLWTPIQQTYTLRRDETIQLPQAFRAAFVKLEFSALNPVPYKISTYPPPPPKVFRRFPTWVEDQFNNSQLRNLVASWFLSNASPVQTNVLNSLSDPVLEFQYEQQQFLAALALGTITDSQIVNSGLVDIADKALIDPTTASKIYVTFDNQYQNTLLLSVDQSSVLGQMVAARFDPSTITDPNEATATSVVNSQVPFVSTSNNRLQESYSNLAQTPMWFNKTSRHVYTEDVAEFNKKAYFVGIEKVRFLRNDYTVERDDPVIIDNLFDDFLLTENTFGAEEGTSIPDGAILYVSYSINPVIIDEQVTLSGFGAVTLAQAGGPAYEVLVFDQPGQQGNQYFQDLDYELSYGFDSDGRLVNTIQRTSFGNRLTVPLQPIVYVDAGTVIGHAVIPSPPTDDAAVVIGVAVVSAAFEGPPVPTYGTGHYGTGTYGDLLGALPDIDLGTVTGVSVIGTADVATFVDAGTIVGVGFIGDPLIGEVGTAIGHSVISSVDTAIYVDNQTVTTVAAPSSTSSFTPVDSHTVITVAVPSATDTAIFVDAQPVFGVGVVSGVDVYIPSGGGGFTWSFDTGSTLPTFVNGAATTSSPTQDGDGAMDSAVTGTPPGSFQVIGFFDTYTGDRKTVVDTTFWADITSLDHASDPYVMVIGDSTLDTWNFVGIAAGIFPVWDSDSSSFHWLDATTGFDMGETGQSMTSAGWDKIRIKATYFDNQDTTGSVEWQTWINDVLVLSGNQEIGSMNNEGLTNIYYGVDQYSTIGDDIVFDSIDLTTSSASTIDPQDADTIVGTAVISFAEADGALELQATTSIDGAANDGGWLDFPTTINPTDDLYMESTYLFPAFLSRYHNPVNNDLPVLSPFMMTSSFSSSAPFANAFSSEAGTPLVFYDNPHWVTGVTSPILDTVSPQRDVWSTLKLWLPHNQGGYIDFDGTKVDLPPPGPLAAATGVGYLKYSHSGGGGYTLSTEVKGTGSVFVGAATQARILSETTTGPELFRVGTWGIGMVYSSGAWKWSIFHSGVPFGSPGGTVGATNYHTLSIDLHYTGSGSLWDISYDIDSGTTTFSESSVNLGVSPGGGLDWFVGCVDYGGSNTLNIYTNSFVLLDIAGSTTIQSKTNFVSSISPLTNNASISEIDFSKPTFTDLLFGSVTVGASSGFFREIWLRTAIAGSTEGAHDILNWSVDIGDISLFSGTNGGTAAFFTDYET